MSDEERDTLTRERRVLPTAVNTLTWQYLGERMAADAAYCVRFGVNVAPEPTAIGGVLSYAVPTDVPRR